MKKIEILDLDIVLNEIEDPKARFDNILIFEDSLTEDDFSKFRSYVIEKNGEYFECEIDGIKKIARFGLVSHRVNSEGFLVRCPVLEKGQERPESKTWYDNDFKRNMERENIKSKIIIERLLDVLLDKDILSKEETAKLTNITKEDSVAGLFDKNTF